MNNMALALLRRVVLSLYYAVLNPGME
jgi:hypothetical protein